MGNSNNNNGNGGMMGGGGNSNPNGRGGAFDSADEGSNVDKLAMLGVLASVKGGASGLWDSYNGCLAEKPILVKVRLVACGMWPCGRWPRSWFVPAAFVSLGDLVWVVR